MIKKVIREFPVVFAISVSIVFVVIVVLIHDLNVSELPDAWTNVFLNLVIDQARIDV